MYLRLFVYLLPFFLSAGVFDWFADPLSPKAERAKSLLEGIEEKIQKAIEEYGVPGIAVGVIVDGHVVLEKGFGFRDLEKNLPVTKDTLFAIGSCTKAFTGFVMGTLVDEGLIRWDQPVIDALPQFRLYDQYATTNVTIRDLLTHRTGMPRHELVWYNSKMNRQELLRKIRYLQPSVDLRSRYQYGQLMYFTAGLAVEEVTGKTWEQLVRERILNPLDMSHTNFTIEEMQKCGNAASPYLEKQDMLKKIPYRNLSLIGAAGCMNSNVTDLCHWVKMQLAGGIYKNSSLISPSTLQELHAPQVVVPGAPEAKETLLYAYGIGWLVLSYRGHYLISHDGVSDGFTSLVAMLPNENMGVIILSNKNMSSLPRYISLEIIDRVLGISHQNWLEEGAETLRKNKDSLKESKLKEDLMRKKGTSHCHPLEEYAGVYENPGYGKLLIEVVDGKLQANFNDLIFILKHWHYDVFSVAEEKQDIIVSLEGTKFTFCNNSNGDIGEVSIPFEPTADDIVFKKRPDGAFSNLSYLRQFIGVYEIYGYTVEMIVRDHMLMAIIPGQPIYELVPTSENEFLVKSMTGSTVRFVLNEQKRVEEVLLVHPYGAFSALPRK